MNILIINGYVRENKGDAALISVLANQLQTVFPHAQIAIAGMEDPEVYSEFVNFKNVGSMRLYAAAENICRPYRILHKISVGCIASLWPTLPFRSKIVALLPRGIRGELSAIENADLIVSASGGYLTSEDSFWGNLNIYYLTAPLQIATRLGKFVVMAPESFGPFGNNWQKTRVRKTLNSARLIFVREDTSYQLLESLGVKVSLLKRTVDSGFAHLPKSHYEPARADDPIRVGITARNWLKGENQSRYEAALAETIAIIERKYRAQIILIPQVTSNFQGDDDRIVETRIKNLAIEYGAHPTQILEQLDQNEIKHLYSGLTFTIGTRFHSVIFSLTSYAPAIAIEYEHKTSGIMRDLGLQDWTVKIEDVTSNKLASLFDRLTIEKDSYIKHLEKVLPTYINRANEVPNLIREVYEDRLKQLA